jgi:hypothetical protein
MVNHRPLSCILLVFVLLSACGRTKPLPQPLPTPSGDWTVKFTQSGGIAGILLTLEISSDGHLKAQDQRTNKGADRTLPQPTITELAGLIAKAKFSPDAAPYPGCADCFIYGLEVQSDGHLSKIRVDDITIRNSGAEELITFLRELRNSALGMNY